MSWSGPPNASTWIADPRNKLHRASTIGTLSSIKAILSSGSIDINQRDPDGCTPALIAAERGSALIVRLLMDNGADVSIPAKDGITPLISSAQNGHLAVVKTLLTGNANLQAACEGYTALHVAASNGRPKVLKALLEAGADRNSRMPNGVTPLYLASMAGELEAVRVLLRARADPLLARAISSWERGIPLDVAAQSGHTEVVREFIQLLGVRACGGESGGVEAYRLAARFRQLGIMHMLADAGVEDTGPALSSAAAYGSLAELKFLFRQQEELTHDYLNNRDHSNRTPVYNSVSFCSPNSPRVLRALIDAGANTTAPIEVVNDGWQVVSRHTPLAIVKLYLREKKVKGEVATEAQLHRLKAMRRLLLQVDAVHAVSWLWPRAAPVTAARGAKGASKVETTPTPLTNMLPIWRRRARRRCVSAAAVFRYNGKKK